MNEKMGKFGKKEESLKIRENKRKFILITLRNREC